MRNCPSAAISPSSQDFREYDGEATGEELQPRNWDTSRVDLVWPILRLYPHRTPHLMPFCAARCLRIFRTREGLRPVWAVAETRGQVDPDPFAWMVHLPRITSFMEAAGERWWPIGGGVYFLHAVKKVRGMRLIMPKWSDWLAPAKRLAASAQRVGAKESAEEALTLRGGKQ
jgi:hypothetical protein